ncbi:MAG: aldehyde dehydrogenase [Verrucomicrobiales bacterium]|nr:aldehyde dehydrogenase [Verrucomicrobiales bacterium]
MDVNLSQLFINGDYYKGTEGAKRVLVNPYTEAPEWETTLGSAEDIDLAVKGAQNAFVDGWRDMTPGKRTEILFKLARLIREQLEELARIESTNIGKPISDARDEIALGARIFEYYAGAITLFHGETIPVSKGGLDITIRQPLGVVGAIVPWNFPFPITCWKVAPALAAGNCVVLKPALLSPFTALKLGELAAAAGLPPGVLQVVTGGGSETGSALVNHPLTRKISFTGSTQVGRQIMRQAADGIKRISLELGGKSPNIVFADCNLEEAASSSPMAVYGNAGQDCCARSRVFVEEKVADQFMEIFLEKTKSLNMGAPGSPSTQIGPLVSRERRDEVLSYIQSESADHLLLGGKTADRKGFFVEPAVIFQPDLNARVWKEEIFGPVVCIRTFKDEDLMLKEVNDSPYGLSASIWTNDIKRAFRVSRKVESGVVSVNSHSSVHVEAPFGGFKQSGIGRDLGLHALEGYTELKNIYFGL